MKITHCLTITCTCPVDQKPDVYKCIVRTRRVIPVEDIIKAVKDLTKEAVFQEDLTQALHRSLACEVETRGWHSGVYTRCVCGDDCEEP